jgi:hypothetical protein
VGGIGRPEAEPGTVVMAPTARAPARSAWTATAADLVMTLDRFDLV